MAAAYAEEGKFNKAISIQQRAISLLGTGNKENLDTYKTRLKFYKAHRPWREK